MYVKLDASPQAEALRKANRFLSQKDGAFQLAASVLGFGTGEFESPLRNFSLFTLLLMDAILVNLQN